MTLANHEANELVYQPDEGVMTDVGIFGDIENLIPDSSDLLISVITIRKVQIELF